MQEAHNSTLKDEAKTIETMSQDRQANHYDDQQYDGQKLNRDSG